VCGPKSILTAWHLPPPFIGQGEAVYGVPHSSSHSDVVPASSACGLIDVLVNLGLYRHHGGFRTCLRSASRVVCLVFAPGRYPCVDSRVSLTGILGLYRGWCGDVLSEHGSTPPSVAPQCQGWPHRGGGDGKNMLRSPRVTAPSWLCTRSSFLRLLRVFPYPLKGRRMGVGCIVCGNDPGHSSQHLHSARTVIRKMAQGRYDRTVLGRIPGRCQGTCVAGIPPLTTSPLM
jgi:hypothetical protein